jgi:hypothetical protein
MNHGPLFSSNQGGGFFHAQWLAFAASLGFCYVQPESGTVYSRVRFCINIHYNTKYYQEGGFSIAFFNSAVGVLQTLVVALGAGLGVWGVINLLEGYGNDNPGAKSQGMKQLMAGGGVALIGILLVPQLSGLFG